jgi:hypothetical protein
MTANYLCIKTTKYDRLLLKNIFNYLIIYYICYIAILYFKPKK